MTVTGWSLVRFAHVLAAMGWVGGQLLLSVVVLPVLRNALGPTERAAIVRQAATRFAIVANALLLPTLVLTGVALAWRRGVRVETLGEDGYGRLLAIKLVLVLMSIGLAAVHGVLATRRPGTARPLGIAGLGASVGIVVFATALVPS
jgi:putative copper export protein